jgi:hypothetical protein
MKDGTYDEDLRFELEIAMIEILFGHVSRKRPFESRLATLRRLLGRPRISIAARLQHSGLGDDSLDDDVMRTGSRPIGSIELIFAVLHGRRRRRTAMAAGRYQGNRTVERLSAWERHVATNGQPHNLAVSATAGKQGAKCDEDRQYSRSATTHIPPCSNFNRRTRSLDPPMLADPLPYRHRNTFRGESREVL